MKTCIFYMLHIQMPFWNYKIKLVQESIHKLLPIVHLRGIALVLEEIFQ